MADAKIINYGQPIGGGTTVVPDDAEVALKIETTTAGEEYILIDSENGAENMTLAGGGYPVQIGSDQRGPRMRNGHGSSAAPGFPVYTFRGDTNTGMTHLGTSNDDALALVAGGVEGIRITESGDAISAIHLNGFVGINDSSPAKRLTLKAGASNEDIFVILSSSGGTCIRDEIYGSDGATRYFKSGAANHIIGAGTTFAGCVFNELGESGVDFRIESDSNTHMFFLDSSENKIGLNESTPSKMLDLMNGASGGDILCFDIFTHDGAVETSDERMKENIVETPLGLDFIKSLNPVAYKWKDTPETRQAYTVPGTPDTPEHVAEQVYPAVTYTRTHHGLLAQEVNAAIESAGLTAKDFAGYCYEEERDEHRLRYSQFIAPLIKSVKELSSQVEALTARVAELESGG